MQDHSNPTDSHPHNSNHETRIMLVDDHDLTREALTEHITAHSGWSVVTEAASGEEAIESVKQQAPDVVAMDMHMPGLNGIETTAELVKISPSIKILIISNYVDTSLVKAAFRAGASGYISKQAAFEELVPGIESVAAGKQYVCRNIQLQLG